MERITEKQQYQILILLKLLELEHEKAKIISFITSKVTTCLQKLWYSEATLIIDILAELEADPSRGKQFLIKEISFMAPYIADHFGYTNGDPVKNCFTIINERVFNLDAAHYFKIHRINNLLSQLYEHIIDKAEIGVIETLKELNIATTN